MYFHEYVSVSLAVYAELAQQERHVQIQIQKQSHIHVSHSHVLFSISLARHLIIILITSCYGATLIASVYEIVSQFGSNSYTLRICRVIREDRGTGNGECEMGITCSSTCPPAISQKAKLSANLVGQLMRCAVLSRPFAAARIKISNKLALAP